MLNRKIDSYLKDYYQKSSNALLITGARQVGKTYSIREFGKTFKSFIEIYAGIHIHRKRKVRFGGETEACID